MQTLTPPWRAKARATTDPPSQIRMPADASAETSNIQLPPIGCLKFLRKLFVVSVCDGIGSIFLALTSLGLSFAAVAAEKEAHLRSLVHEHFPHVTPWSDMLKLTLQDIVTLSRKELTPSF